MSPNLHILTKEQMLHKFIDEGWEQNKLPGFDYDIPSSGRYKTCRRWRNGTTVMAFLIDRAYPNNPSTVVCLLRDENNNLYSYDEAFFAI